MYIVSSRVLVYAQGTLTCGMSRGPLRLSDFETLYVHDSKLCLSDNHGPAFTDAGEGRLQSTLSRCFLLHAFTVCILAVLLHHNPNNGRINGLIRRLPLEPGS